MTELRLSDVSKRYGAAGTSATAGDESETIALQNVDLTVRDGEFFTLVGPSGCGKTTTLRTIAGFEEPTTGTVAFDGEPVTDVPPEERDIGIVFQSYALFPHLSVAENVSYGLKFREPPGGMSVDERVQELLKLVDLEGMGERNPTQLSGGQQQRVALARALAPAPALLLLDEPMSALDARLRESLRRQLSRIQSELEITTIYVTHDQAEALAISDRVAVMHDGAVEQVGRPQQIYHEPETRFVAEFVGDNNVFDGDVVDHDGTLATVTVSGPAGDAADIEFELAGVPSSASRVTACVRPGQLSRDASQNQFRVTVETTEFLGERVRVHGQWNGLPIVLRLADTPTDSCHVGFDPAAAHIVAVD
ncbi:ABC-type transport system ATP-binding protein (probable substrate thiamine) [Natrialba magadii ATCC 43099]|uniref:Molybdate/tungstate import ATP-binding protein WtpC n=1 Tax=Natrialba magadii (strain ATCC 43099 / DSM 3394 / CCM 3739 / CIP 104546 / IAM 13178 / JCM 8861 / NBRC 102185 / NCIMB 2190 / MS3) TaxID=547559 RepID=D3SY10_NATMM|nr:ABC transporter ATP-binding protein [Natrialba magadii]ADD04050.1 ABC-type transport system ATP-binding protein (probable substrate thiamine) [Natrialba magadii ATCC 43099]ELY33208.1 ABC transporter [Natrialba magadii ATCC 43099]